MRVKDDLRRGLSLFWLSSGWVPSPLVAAMLTLPLLEAEVVTAKGRAAGTR